MRFRSCLILILLMSFAVCNLRRAKSPQFGWGQSVETVKASEYERLGTMPVEQQRFPHSDIAALVYQDRLLKAACLLTYWFDLDSLQAVTYSCSDPDWNEEDLKRAVSRQLAAVYGEPVLIVKGKKQYDYYPDKNNHTYFRFVRIAQDRELWRTFQANIVISHYAHTDYPLVAELLSKWGSD